jgi:hypothetical protein
MTTIIEKEELTPTIKAPASRGDPSTPKRKEKAAPLAENLTHTSGQQVLHAVRMTLIDPQQDENVSWKNRCEIKFKELHDVCIMMYDFGGLDAAIQYFRDTADEPSYNHLMDVWKSYLISINEPEEEFFDCCWKSWLHLLNPELNKLPIMKRVQDTAGSASTEGLPNLRLLPAVGKEAGQGMTEVDLSPSASPRTRAVVSNLQKDNQELKDNQQILLEQNKKLQDALEELRMMVSKRKHTEGSASSSEVKDTQPAPAPSPSSSGSPPTNIKYAVDLEESDIEIESDPKKAKGLEESWVDVPDVMEKPKAT